MPAGRDDEAEPVDPAAVSSSDDRDLGWGGREWADSDDADLERLRADRPPHHEERER